MRLIDKTIDDFSNILASDAPAPGGGSTAALCGSLGTSLIQMVCALTIGKQKYAEHDDILRETFSLAEKVRHEFLLLIDKDTEAFDSVTAVFKMPKNTDDDKIARSAAMQEALKLCTITPFNVIKCSIVILEQTKKILSKYNTNTASDLGVAVINLKAAAQGAWLNILINLDGIKDEEFRDEHKENGENFANKAITLADEIYNKIKADLYGQ